MDFKIIAVDFDGTLCENKWPEIGKPNLELIAYLKAQRDAGMKLILWTCRVGNRLMEAVQWCHARGLYFDAVNENLPEVLEWMGGDSRKIFAHEYIDDKSSAKFNLPFAERESEENISKKETDDLIEAIAMLSEIDSDIEISQSTYVVEECSELIKELMKEKRGKGDDVKIIEEVCDVLTTIFVLLYQRNVPEEYIKKQILFKCNRTVERYRNDIEKIADVYVRIGHSQIIFQDELERRKSND